MEGADSPLEVLSLAATMVQDRYLPPSYEEARRVLPTAEWRKERRGRDRLPDYDSSKCTKGGSDAPLDMTTRRAELDRDRGSPPSYSQSISQPGYRRGAAVAVSAAATPSGSPSGTPAATPSGAPSGTTPWPSVVRLCSRIGAVEQQADSTQPEPNPRKGGRKELITGGGASDPDIDEHFRRSLGEDYLNVFCKTSKKDDSSDGEAEPADSSADMVTPPSGLSVDDHFAKALGETWLKLQAESASPAPDKQNGKEPRRAPTGIKTVNGLTVAFPVKSPKPQDTSSREISRQRRGLVS